ncbi:hypothetical protein ABT56_15220 [Photobacterium aquae]|uniref:Methyltransferase domain-containing protein n=1 Tax=Photobacterium aquae TaxID=1195763 RepID=A0A0J1GXT8_9GAMM|nr:class I SAM-dependent methyltransferase [Photobacterium aquae]KLV04480.1 hypothetical protein ABT56_15220 [Photobacterium aquae]
MPNYYSVNAQAFFDGTVNVDMSSLYSAFLPVLPFGGAILDAGCGSGRDSHYFVGQGFAVTAFDASDAMVALASEYSGLSVHHATFSTFTAPPASFDGIWACASLLHVPADELHATFAHLATLLKPEGLFYCSFKYGKEEVERDGRRFTNLDEVGLGALLVDTLLTVKQTWITGDLRPGRDHEKWLNALLVKRSDLVK